MNQAVKSANESFPPSFVARVAHHDLDRFCFSPHPFSNSRQLSSLLLVSSPMGMKGDQNTNILAARLSHRSQKESKKTLFHRSLLVQRPVVEPQPYRISSSDGLLAEMGRSLVQRPQGLKKRLQHARTLVYCSPFPSIGRRAGSMVIFCSLAPDTLFG